MIIATATVASQLPDWVRYTLGSLMMLVGLVQLYVGIYLYQVHMEKKKKLNK